MPSLRDVLQSYRLQKAEKRLAAVKQTAKPVNYAEIEQKAFEEESKRIAAEQEDRAKEAAQVAKAAAKEAADAAKAKQIAENNAKEAAWRRDRRPMYVDANGVIQSHYTDEEWAAEKAKKGAKLQEEKAKAEAEKQQKQALAAVEEDVAVTKANDQAIQRAGQKQALDRDAEKAKYKRVVDEYEKRLKDIDDGKLEVKNYEGTVKSMTDTIAQAKQRLADLDAAETARKREVLDFDTQQDQRRAALEKRAQAIKRGEVSDLEAGRGGDLEKPGTAGRSARAPLITDPAQFEAAAAELTQKQQALQAANAQREADLAKLEQENARLLSLPHSAADLSADGKWHRDLIPQVNARVRKYQQEAPQEAARVELEAQAERLNASAKLINEQAAKANAQAKAEQARQAVARKQQLADLAAGGHETQARKIQSLDQEAEARLADIAEMYPENSPERQAAVQAVQQDIASKQAAVGQEIEQQAQKARQVYEEFGRGYAVNWITGEQPDVNDQFRTGALVSEGVQANLVKKAKELGMTEKDLRYHLETHRLMDWSTPSTTAANKQQSGVAHELAKKLDLIGVAEPTRTLPSGDIMPNPELGQSQAKFDEAIDAAIGTKAAKERARALWPQYREMWIEAARATLETSETLPGVESYQDWRYKNAAHLGGMTENQKAELYIQKMEKRGWPRKFLDNVSANLMAGSHDILTAIYGTGAVLTGAVEKATGLPMLASEVLSEAAAEKSQQAQKLTQAQGIEGISGLGQGIIGQGARMAPGAIATMATGTMTGAMVAGAMQTGGMTYADAYHSLIEQGYDHADAWAQAAPASTAAGAMTAVLTKAFPGGVTALNNAANRTALQQGIQQAIRTFAASATSMGKAAVKGFVDEVPQEIMDEAFSQFAQGQAEGRAPREVVSEFLTGLPELIGAAGLMGAGGEVIGSRGQGKPGVNAPAVAPVSPPSPAPSLVGAVPSSEPEAAPESELSKPDMSKGAVEGGNPVPAQAADKSVRAPLPEKWAAAEAALASFADKTTLPPEVADKTAQKGRVLLKIAQGAKPESLDNDDLHLVGLHRDDAGKITQGHMSKNGWKKGPNPNGSPQPVEMLNGEFVITDRQIERLRNKEVGLGALADAIALPAAERRAQILETPAANLEQAQRATEISRELASRGLDEATAQAVAAEIVAEQGVVGENYIAQMTDAAFEPAMRVRGWRKMPSSKTLRFERVSTDQKRNVPSSQANVPSQSSKAPAEAGTTSPGGQVEMADTLTDQMPASGAVASLAKQRAPMLKRLRGYGVVVRVVKSAKEAAEIIGQKVKSGRRGLATNVNGVPHVILINPDGNPDLLDTFDHEAIHAADLVFENQNPELAAKADAVLDRTSPEFDAELYHFMAQEYDGFADLTLRQKNKEARRAIIEGRWKGKTSTRSKGFRRYLTDFLAHLKKVFTGKQSAALKDAIDNIEFVLGIQDQTTAATEEQTHSRIEARVIGAVPQGTPLGKAKDWIVQLKRLEGQITEEEMRALRSLQILIDGKAGQGGLGKLFNAIVLVDTNGKTGFSVVPVQGKYVLQIDPRTFAKIGALTDEGIFITSSEELAHALALATVSEAEAIRRMRVMEQHAPEAQRIWWQAYYAKSITDGLMPANPPVRLTDKDAYLAFHEMTRMMWQKETFAGQIFHALLPGADAVTTETVEPVRDLLDWLVDVLRTMGRRIKEAMQHLPPAERTLWDEHLEKMRNLYRRAIKMQQTLDVAVLEMQAEEMAAKRPAKPAGKLRIPEGNARAPVDDSLDDEIDAAWEAEQKARRKKPAFTPAQQALRGLRAITDPDNGEINVISRIALQGGMAVYSPVLKARALEGKAKGGELDWLERADIPPFWKGVIFRRGTKQEVQAVLEQLHREGYFPGVAEAGDVTGEMLAAKIKDVLDRYTALKKGEVSNLDEAEGEHFGKLEAQRVEFERSTADGPVKVRPADLQVGDVMQVKGDDGKLHPVKVKGMETRPLESDEEFDPEANPGHRLGPDGPEVIESVTLEDGTTFGVQTIDGQEGLYVDEFKVKSGADWYDSLREAILSKKLTDEDALLHFMEHEGLGADAAWADIVGGLQRKLGLSMKKAQKLLASVFDTSAKAQEWSEAEKAATLDSPLSSAPKRSWTPETKQVQDASIDAIFASLYGSRQTSTPRLGPDHGRHLGRLARQVLEREMAGHARPAETPTAADLQAESAILADWARENGLLLTQLPAQFQADNTSDLGQMEHSVWPSADEERLVKLTNVGNYGLWPVVDGIGVDMRAKASSPSRYLARLTDSNAVFDDDWVLHGVLVDRRGQAQILTSQPYYDGTLPGELVDHAPADEQDLIREQQMANIHAAMAEQGFAPVSISRSMFYRASDNTAVFDAHLYNLMRVQTPEFDGWMPFDVIVTHPQGRMKENLQKAVIRPIQTNASEPANDALYSGAKRAAGPTLFGADEMNFLGDKNTLGLFEQKAKPSPSPRPQVSPSPSPAFSLESTTPEQLDAEARRKKLKAELQARQDKPLIGTQGDIGQMDMLGGNDLLSMPPVAKPSTSTTLPHAPATPGSLESDRPRDNAGKPGRTRGLPPAGGQAGTDDGELGQGGDAGQDTRVGGDPPARGDAADAGSGSAEPVQGQAPRVPAGAAGSVEPGGSRGIDEPRAAVESGAELDLPGLAPARPSTDEVAAERESTPRERQLEQVKVQTTPSAWDGFKVADAESIAKSLPMLLPQQQEDVLKAERRFFKQEPTADDPRKGILFTNGTGTGKTFTGLGIIKRFEMMGKDRILIIVPSQQKVADWQSEGQRVMVKATPLKDTNDIGEGVVVTTYANMRDNWRLQAEPWDLVVYDESHNLSSNAQGTEGANIAAHELVTAKPGWNSMKKWIMAEIGPPPPWDDKDATMRYENLAEQAWKRIQYRRDVAPETRAVFLSATPFAYHKNLKYADGFLYRSPETKGTGYNVPQGFDKYLVENFGYSMRTNRLTSPGPEVDVGLMEREWAERQFKQGSMTGRMIDVPYDYSREFVLLDSQTGKQLDDGFSNLMGWGGEMTREQRDHFSKLTSAFYDYWYRNAAGYTRRMQFLESIKVADALERMNQHLDVGRKIVLFHSYNNAEPVHPFQLGYLELDAEGRQLAQEWMKNHPALVQMNFKRLENPRALVAGEFGERVRFFNGEEKGKDRSAAIKAFNDDNSGVDIIMVQMDAGKEGISLHDVTGPGKQRVLMNAALPVKPTDAIQTEGRIYRIGVQSNAIQEYLVLHTQMERSAFGSKISTRTGTVENMALGKMARTLTDSFKSGYLNAHSEAPSTEQGLGGKKQDAAELLGSDMDRAKSYYFGRMKKTSRNKAAEGVDYFATPEPVGLTMVRFLEAKAGMDLLEPSAGHGAIGRFFPDYTANKFVEPSRTLADELRIKVAAGKVEMMPFEDLHIVNKFDGVAMNPPFGTAGKLAIEHIAKAAQHLRQGGRLVAILPEGPAMEKRFEKWLENEGRDMHLRASYGLPTVTFERAGTSVKTRIVVLDKADLWTIRREDSGVYAAYDSFGEKRSAYKGDERSVREAAEWQADFIGWSGQTRIENRSPRELYADTINELFDQLEGLEPPSRITKNVATGEVASVPAPVIATPAPLPAKPPSPLAAFLQGGRGAILPVSAPAAAPSAPITPAPVPEASKPLYEAAQTLHAKRGTMTYVAKFTRRIGDADYAAEKARAKQGGGYYSAFKGNGAIPGFQFESAEKRDAFVEGYRPNQTLGSAAKRRDFTSNLADSLKASAAGLKQERVHPDPSSRDQDGPAPADLKRLIDVATKGLSTVYAPLERVFLAAKSVNRNLTEREFGQMIAAADAAGQVMLEPAESPATVEKANVFGVRMASGVPAWGVAWNPDGATVKEEPFKLDNGEIQAYLDLPDVKVPASKQPAAKRAIRAAGEVATTAYEPLPARRGGAGQRDRLADLRERAQRKWRGLMNQDVEALKEAFRESDSFSNLLHQFTTREIPAFDIRGAIIEHPADFAAFSLAVRSPFFETLKIAIVDNAHQVIHSQVVHVGGLNEAVADTKTIAGIIATTRMMYPKARLVGWIIAHNHPSGDPSPSDADRRVTRRFVAMGEHLGLPMLDHVVTNGEKYFSFRESGMVSSSIEADIDLRASRAGKPKLPVLPTPPRPDFGNVADWEVVPSGSLGDKADSPTKALPYLRALRTADPDHYHVLYLDTRLGVRAVERLPVTLTTPQMFQRIALGSAREGAYGFTLGFPGQPVPAGQVNDQQRRMVRTLRERAEAVGLKLLDAMNTTPDKFFSWAESGLLEAPAEYGPALGSGAKRAPSGFDIGPVFHGNRQGGISGTFKGRDFGTWGQHPFIYFAESEKWVEKFLDEEKHLGDAPQVDSYHLQMKHPLDLRTVAKDSSRGGALNKTAWQAVLKQHGIKVPGYMQQAMDKTPAWREVPVWQWFRLDQGDFRDALRDAGFDGVIFKDVERGKAARTTYAVLNPEQIWNPNTLGSAAKRSPVDAAAHEAATSPLNDLTPPTKAQQEAGNYPKGHVTIGGHAISIENPAGSKRRPEWPPLKDHYGYFKGTNAKDGDHVDVFVKPGTAADYAGPVHVVRQNKVERSQGQGDLEKGRLGERARQRGFDIGPVFHGTPDRSFTEFSKAAINDDEEAGIFFTTSKQTASHEDYTDGGRGRVIEAYLKAKNPYRVTIQQWNYQEGLSPAEAFAKGHDAYVIEGQDNATTYIVPEPRQILSNAAETAVKLTPTKQFDEYKVMLGYPTAAEAKAAYLRNYEPGWPGLERMTTHTMPEFMRIKDAVFTVKPKDVPGVRESDQVLASAHPPVTHTFPDGYHLTGPGLHTLGSAAKRGLLNGLSKADWNHTDKLLTAKLAGPLVKAGAMFKKAGGWVADKAGIPDTEAMLEYLAEWSVQGHASRHGVAAETVDLKALKEQQAAAFDAAKAAGKSKKELAALKEAQAREVTTARKRHLTPAQMAEFKAGQKAQFRRLLNQVKRQILPDSAIPADILAKRIEMNAATSLAQEKALDVAGRAFKGKAKFTDMALDEHFNHPETKRRMFLAMDGNIEGGITMASLPENERKVAETLKAMREQHAQERLKAGRLSLDAYHRLKEGMPHYYADDVKAERSMLRRMALGLKRVLAQRGTAFHIVDTATKDADGADALVPWTPPKQKTPTWWFKTQEQMDAHYEQHIAEQILAAKRTTGAQSMAELDPADRKALKSYGWMTDADRAALAGVTRESLNAPAALTDQQRAVIERLEEQLRRRFQKKVPLTFDEHQKAGLIMDPFYAIGRQLAEAGHDNATAEFFNYIAKHPEYTSDVAQAGFTEMPDTPALGRLAAKWVRDDVAAEVREMTEIPHIVAQFYDWLLSLFKFGHTVLNVGSHIRNVIGNISLAHIAGNNPLNPGNWPHYAEAMRMLRTGDGIENLYKQGILGGDYLTAEIKRTLRQLMPDAKTVMDEIEQGNLTWLLNFKEFAARKLEGMTKIPGKVADAAAAAWKWEDDIYKVAAFVKAKSMGNTDAEATAHVRKWFTFYDGGNSSLLKNVGRFVFPFLSFKRESARILGNALRERPLAALTTLLLPRALTQASLTVAEWKILMFLLGTGLGADDEDKKDIIANMKGKAGRLLAPITDASLFSILLPWRDENGGLMQWDLSAVHPFADWLSTRIEDDSTMKWWQRTAQDMAAGSPFVGLFGEITMNKDFFSGSRLWEDDMPDSEAAGLAATHAWKKLAPPHFGAHPAALKRSLERSPSKLMPARSFWQQMFRTLGVDIKPAGPDLYKKAADYREKNNLPASSRADFETKAPGRARKELYRLAIQPVIDVEAFTAQVERLEQLGHPVSTKDLMDIFERQEAEDIMAQKSHQQKFLRTLPPESKRIMEAAKTQQQAALPRAQAALRKANELREARKKIQYGGAKP